MVAEPRQTRLGDPGSASSLAFVFIFEGYQKRVFPEVLGAGRFATIGIPAAELMGPFVGVV